MEKKPNADEKIDCTGLFCPMPVVKTKFEMEKMRPGQVLEVLADDPGFEKDLPKWCEMTGEKCLGIVKEGAIYHGFVKKS